MCRRCDGLIKAIDAYITKAEGDLASTLSDEGYTKGKKTAKIIRGIWVGGSGSLQEEERGFFKSGIFPVFRGTLCAVYAYRILRRGAEND